MVGDAIAIIVVVHDAGVRVELEQHLGDRKLFDVEHFDPDAVDHHVVADFGNPLDSVEDEPCDRVVLPIR